MSHSRAILSPVMKMSLKDQILETLESCRGTFVSGGELAALLQVSRSAVWKAIKQLRGEGHDIGAVTNRGYCLSEASAVLTAAAIGRHLDPALPLRVEVTDSVPSTNTVLKERAAAGAAEGAVLVAREQTAGKGRQGRPFYSAPGTGCYFSLLLRPQYTLEDAAMITTAAATAAAEAIEAVSGKAAEIKWVNDVFVAGKKVCGILTEASVDMEGGGLEYAVLGVGINLREPAGGFPEEIRGIAGALNVTDADGATRLIGDCLSRFWAYYTRLPQRLYLDGYRARSMVLGRDVTVLSGAGERTARALAIDDACGLRVRYEDGMEETLYSGEVRVKMKGSK